MDERLLTEEEYLMLIKARENDIKDREAEILAIANQRIAGIKAKAEKDIFEWTEKIESLKWQIEQKVKDRKHYAARLAEVQSRNKPMRIKVEVVQ